MQREYALEVLRLLVTPNECYHSALENRFEYGASREREACGSYCSFCLGHIRDMTGVFVKRNLISFLSSFVAATEERPKWKHITKNRRILVFRNET